ncbi:leucine-rich repeat-containing protein 75A-like [Coregonus clupeaformis]|uniref:leucine-rich repeat-containing protein 75A-like n=1 Tax=Coregonus clupeaformis TaxID=59861 RepID=UPI001E1C844E|nr:leucine-rich repeat-containing protein 75A-like [Coregonus clupeaformis]
MGMTQTKGATSDSGRSCSLLSAWRRTQSEYRRRSSGDRLGSGGAPPPYQRRISMIQGVLMMARDGRQEDATELLKTLRQDLGMESTSLDDVLYRYASFRNLVDPITHDLIISLARCVTCPKTERDSLGAMEKVCHQLMYHLSPHSQWRRQGLLKSKLQPSLKVALSSPPVGDAVDLSGVPLGVWDMECLAAHLCLHTTCVRSLELGFTELTDQRSNTRSQQRGHLFPPSALPHGPKEALPQAVQAAHHPGAGRCPETGGPCPGKVLQRHANRGGKQGWSCGWDLWGVARMEDTGRY